MLLSVMSVMFFGMLFQTGVAMADDDPNVKKYEDEIQQQDGDWDAKAAQKLKEIIKGKRQDITNSDNPGLAIDNRGVAPGINLIFRWVIWGVAATMGLLVMYRAMLIIFGGPEKAEMAKSSMKNILVGYTILTSISIVITLAVWIFTGKSGGSGSWVNTFIPIIPPWR